MSETAKNRFGSDLGTENGSENETAKRAATKQLFGRIMRGFWKHFGEEHVSENEAEKRKAEKEHFVTERARRRSGGGHRSGCLSLKGLQIRHG